VLQQVEFCGEEKIGELAEQATGVVWKVMSYLSLPVSKSWETLTLKQHEALIRNMQWDSSVTMEAAYLKHDGAAATAYE
jgi:hypothetical protein